MTALSLKEQPHRRYNPLTREWLLVSPHRTQRPWQGQVVDSSGNQYTELRALKDMMSVSLLEDRDERMGASNPHPNCHIWASESLPNEPAKENASQLAYSRSPARCLLCDYLTLERDHG